MLARQAYLERAERAHQATRTDLQRHELELAQRRAALTEAARERQALERLKEIAGPTTSAKPLAARA